MTNNAIVAKIFHCSMSVLLQKYYLRNSAVSSCKLLVLICFLSVLLLIESYAYDEDIQKFD